MTVAIVASSGQLEDGESYTPLIATGTNRLVAAFSLLTDTGSSGATLTDHQLNAVDFAVSALLEDSASNPDLYAALGYFLDGVATAGQLDLVLSSGALNDVSVIVEFSGVDQTTPIDVSESQATFDENRISGPSFTIDYEIGDAVVYMVTHSNDETDSAPADLTGGGTFTQQDTDDGSNEWVGGGMPDGSLYIAIADSTQTAVAVSCGLSGNTNDVGAAIWVVKASTSVPSASGAVSITPVTADGAATVGRKSSGAVSIPAITASGSAVVRHKASGSPSIPPIEGDGAASVPSGESASGAVSITPVEGDGAAVVRRKASGDVEIPSVAASGSAGVRKQASGNVVVPGTTATGAAKVRHKASGAVSIPAITADGAAAPEGVESASGDVSISPITSDGAATVTKKVSGDVVLPSITADGSAIVRHKASGSPVTPAVSGSGQAKVRHSASGVVTVPAITARGIALFGSVSIISTVELESRQIANTLESADHSSITLESREITQDLEGRK